MKYKLIADNIDIKNKRQRMFLRTNSTAKLTNMMEDINLTIHLVQDTDETI